MRRDTGAIVALLVGLLADASSRADSIVPAPGESGHDGALAIRAEAYDRQIHALMTPQVGWGLEATVDDPANRARIEEFFASGANDFRTHTGMHPYQVVTEYGEFGDLGMFGGVQAAGDAFRYAVLRDSGAPAGQVNEARAALLRAIDGLHWYHQVTGVPGVVARGIRRRTPAAGEPPLPGILPATVPLRDAAGNPQPADKTPTWRDDNSGALPFLIWLDDSSKDQLDGYIFALGVVYDVIAGDPSIPRPMTDALVEDARAIGRRLMLRVEVSPGHTADLVMQDADGRVTSFHDLSAEEIVPGAVFANATNGFNGLMGLGIMRTIFHVTGDEAIGRFYYGDLIAHRRYIESIERTISAMYVGRGTNSSNINMAFVAVYGLLRYESDRTIGLRIRNIVERQMYAPGVDRDADDLGQSFFDFIYVGFRVGGPTNAGADARADGIRTLGEFPAPPYWNREVINCDAAEIASRACVAADGTAIPLSMDMGRGGGVVAVDPVPMRLRPPSNFEWRDEAHRVNGGGGTRLNPGGDFHGAYWMGRYLRADLDGFANLSPRARPPVVIPPSMTDAGMSDAGNRAGDATVGGDAGTSGGAGCGCRTIRMRGSRRSESAAALAAALTIVARRRRSAR